MDWTRRFSFKGSGEDVKPPLKVLRAETISHPDSLRADKFVSYNGQKLKNEALNRQNISKTRSREDKKFENGT